LGFYLHSLLKHAHAILFHYLLISLPMYLNSL
jgi:hypothetical protein